MLLNILIVFYMNWSKTNRGEQDDDNDEKNVNENGLRFELFSHFCSRFLINMNFLGEGKIENAFTITHTLVETLKMIRGYLPQGQLALRKSFFVKISRRFLALDRENSLSDQEVKVRGLRLCMLFHLFIRQFLADSSLVRYLNSAIIEGGDKFHESELISGLEDLMNSGFEFDLHMEKVQNFTKEKLDKTSNTLFSKLSKLCKVNVSTISGFIPLEIYPLFITKRLQMEHEKIDFGTLYKFTQAFVDRIETSKIGVNFKEYFRSAFAVFVAFIKFKVIDEAGNYPKFLQAFFVALALVHSKAQRYIEDMVETKLQKMLNVASR